MLSGGSSTNQINQAIAVNNAQGSNQNEQKQPLQQQPATVPTYQEGVRYGAIGGVNDAMSIAFIMWLIGLSINLFSNKKEDAHVVQMCEHQRTTSLGVGVYAASAIIFSLLLMLRTCLAKRPPSSVSVQNNQQPVSIEEHKQEATPSVVIEMSHAPQVSSAGFYAKPPTDNDSQNLNQHPEGQPLSQSQPIVSLANGEPPALPRPA